MRPPATIATFAPVLPGVLLRDPLRVLSAMPERGGFAPTAAEQLTDLSASGDARGEVVVVEDSPEDFRAVQRTLRKLGLQTSVRRFEEGQAFFNYLRERAEAESGLPSLVLLDLNMPGVDGREVLVELEADERFSGRFPVVVLSTSSDDDDIAFCASHGAASYMTKPMDLSGLSDCLSHVRAYLVDGRPLPPRC